MGKKDKVLVFGTGSLAVRNLNILKKMNIYDEVEILGFLDNNSAKWGSKIDKYNIYSVNELQNIEYDYICIWSSYKSEIRKQLIETLNIEKNKIKEIFIEYLESVITKYKDTSDIEIKNILEKMKKTEKLSVYYFDDNDFNDKTEAFYDSNVDLFYIIFEKKRLYLKRGFNVYKEGNCYYTKTMWYEQLPNSPHRYFSEINKVEDGDVFVDAGACEGNISLKYIEKVSKCYLIETDSGWIEALENTFKPWRNKVVIINSFLSDGENVGEVKLDDIIKDNVNVLKMDIEGAEVKALKGAQIIFEHSAEIKVAICTYHRSSDLEEIKRILEEYGLCVECSKGYMLYLYDDEVLQKPELRKGVLRGKR